MMPAILPDIRRDAYHGSGRFQAVTDSVDYEVEKAEDRIEIRRYPKMLLATVYGCSDNVAFGILFDYIAGNNKSKRKISMTVPVISSEKIAMTAPVISDRQSFSFAMPASYNLETIPDPVDTRARIEEVPARRVAVIRFRGHASETAVRSKTTELRAFIKRLDLTTKGMPFLMRYNPPFTPGFLRRNEVGLEIAP
jgi:effector-binding domain-containing protein